MGEEQLLDIALQSARLAGAEIMNYYRHGNFDTEIKGDESPVTSADLAANQVLMDRLKTLTPDIPIISEELDIEGLAQRKLWSKYWLLDPIDGTGEFIIGSGDFAVNIALIENGWPSIGVIHAPDHCLTYYGQKHLGAFKDNDQGSHQIRVASYKPGRAVKVAISRRQELSLMGQYLSSDFDFEYIALGSCSLKNCLIAEGGADCYLRIGPTGEWDTGASQCILEQAGGSILDSEFHPLSYNCRDTLMNPDFISMGDRDFPWKQIIHPHKTLR
ncbi:3'(2'),5'-bisphosphate nucleotidase CysQ [Thalassomonas viridans]|uniref:3'(2'),5'-bisphosphate nucleotidase CysQ n=1 Tax=Thalassomonas viridans TaxID=137584 RepID=A0AAE9Z419_9GAMM|nr:3'(2'),5'-bisphosphate nucleotidase CysQ [Thalassomonas viridans]WDE05634.1 3'(2'),5'-bisphosphate nucleotidase CysQ [Thalassomonas viridans]